MNSVHIETKTVREYLLGALTDDVAMAVEELYFTNRLFFSEVRSAELALISDYLDGTLAITEREQFEKRYLRVPTLRKLVEDVRQRRLTSASSVRRRLLRAAFAVAMVCLAVIACVIILRQPSRHLRGSLETKPTETQLFLSPGVTKGPTSQPKQLILPIAAQPTKIIAELPGQRSAADYVAQVSSVDNDGALKAIWTSSPLRSIPGARGQQAIVVLPSSAFSSGDYILELKTLGGSVREKYLFSVIPSRP